MDLLDRKWTIRRTRPDTASKPSDLSDVDVFTKTVRAGPVAAVLQSARIDLSDLDSSIDDFDWWFEATFDVDPSEYSGSLVFRPSMYMAS